MNEQKKYKAYPIVIGFLTALCVGLAAWAGFSYFQSHRYKIQLENTYLRAIDETSDNITNISSDLIKGLYAGTPTQMSLISSKLWKEASTAKAALSALPVAELNLENTYRFLSQVGDYAMYLSKKSVSEQKITPEERQQFVALREYSDRLGLHVQEVENQLYSGELTVSQLAMRQANNMNGVDTRANNKTDSAQQEHGSTQNDITANQQGDLPNSEPKNVNNLTQQVSAPAVTGKGQGEGSSQASEDDGNNDFSAMEKGFIGYPSLIYDGPFSDHLLDKTPEMTTGAPIVTEEKAKEKAMKAAQLPASEAATLSLREEASVMPSYVFYRDSLSVAVTKNGGFLSYMVNPKPSSGAKEMLSKEQGIAAAQKYLESLGISSMKDSYYEINDGFLTANFAHYEGSAQVICYTDLIKVEISLYTGEITGFDCRGYLVNHKPRTLATPKLTKAEAQKSLSENLTVNSIRLALIPTDGKNEVLTYEFLTTGTNGDRVLVYVNTQTGVEEQILILLESPSGILTK